MSAGDPMHVEAEKAGAQKLRDSYQRVLRSLGPLLGLIFVWVLFAILDGSDFVDWQNQRLMLLQTAVIGTAAVGATIIIISGGIDLSVGSSIALGTMIVAKLLTLGASPFVAGIGGVGGGVLCGLAVGALVIGEYAMLASLLLGGLGFALLIGPLGLFPSLLVGLLLAGGLGFGSRKWMPRLPLAPFIVTLGMWGALRGVAKGLGDNMPIYPDDLGGLAGLMSNADSGLFSIVAPGVWILVCLALVMGAVLAYTRFGRYVFAIGSNEQTARLCGIRIERVKLWIYVIGIACAGLAAVLQFSFLSMGDPTTADGYELKVIAAVVIGGASLTGGEGSIRGSIIGALIMTVVDNGCTKLGIENWVQDIVTGGIIVTAVCLDRLRHREA